MLKKEQIQKLEQLFKIKGLADAIASEQETEIEIPEVEVFSKDDLATRDTNKVQLGRDLQMKDLKKEAGFEYNGEGSLDIKRFLTEHKTKVEGEAVKEPDAKLKSLNEQITLLQKKNQEYEQSIEGITKKARDAEFDASLLSELPANRSKLISDKEYLTLIKANLEFTEEGIKKGGELLRDSKTASPIARKDALDQFFTERKWTEEKETIITGRGGENSKITTGKPSNIKEAEEQFKKDNPNTGTGTAEFQTYVMGLKKTDPNFNVSIATA